MRTIPNLFKSKYKLLLQNMKRKRRILMKRLNLVQDQGLRNKVTLIITDYLNLQNNIVSVKLMEWSVNKYMRRNSKRAQVPGKLHSCQAMKLKEAPGIKNLKTGKTRMMLLLNKKAMQRKYENLMKEHERLKRKSTRK